jgi:4-oxalomesaconate hydratase
MEEDTMDEREAPRILVFSAHAADFCSRCGGTIAVHARRGGAVRVIALTLGERSESGGLYAGGATPPLADVKAIRRQEATRAAEILGTEIDFLDWGDLSFDFSLERVKCLAIEIRAFRPDVLLTHHGPDPVSVDHDTTWQLARRAVQVAGAAGLESDLPPVPRPQVFLFEATIPLTEVEGFAPDVYVDITGVWEIKLEALEAFRRAQGFLAPWYTQVAQRRAFQARSLSHRRNIAYAEAFERVLPWVGDRLPL